MATTTNLVKAALEATVAAVVRSDDEAELRFVRFDDAAIPVDAQIWTSAAERTFDVIAGEQRTGEFWGCGEIGWITRFHVTIIYPRTGDYGTLLERVRADAEALISAINTQNWIADVVRQRVVDPVPAPVLLDGRGWVQVIPVDVENYRAV